MSESAARCRHCHSTRIDAEVEWTGMSYEPAEVEFDRTGRPTALVEADRGCATYEETGTYRCRGCLANGTLDDLVEPREGRAGLIPEAVQLAAGLCVVLPDGLRGTVATVEDDGEAFTVVGWHERFDRREARLIGVAA